MRLNEVTIYAISTVSILATTN